MKKIIIILILISQTLTAQTSKKFVPGKIILEDGSELNGYVFDLKSENLRHKYINDTPLNSRERTFDIKFNKVVFKKTKKSKKTYINIDRVKQYIVYDKDMQPTVYYKLKLKSFNSKLKPVELSNTKILAPLIKDGQLQVYGYKVFINGAPVNMLYLKNKDDEYAYIPSNHTKMTINFKLMKTIVQKLLKAFEYTGHDCPEFETYIRNEFNKTKNKSEWKKMKNDFLSTYRAHVKKRKKLSKLYKKKLISKEEFDKRKEKINQERKEELMFNIDYYLNKYETMCENK